MEDGICPVAALLTWMLQRGSPPGPLFVSASGKALTRSAFVTKLREALADAGLDPTGFSGHSFRSEAATTAVSRGVTDAHIKQLGRWKSSEYLRYIRPPVEHLASLSKVLAQTPITASQSRRLSSRS